MFLLNFLLQAVCFSNHYYGSKLLSIRSTFTAANTHFAGFQLKGILLIFMGNLPQLANFSWAEALVHHEATRV